MRECMVCYKSFEGKKCPRCGFTHYDEIGDPEAARKILEPIANIHRTSEFLNKYDIGVTCYYWKDQDGTIALDTTKRLSFGTADKLEKQAIWLDQEFARLPDEDEITLELSIQKSGEAPYPIQVRLPALKEKQLQRLGVTLTERLQLQVLLKNDDKQVHSEPAGFLPE